MNIIHEISIINNKFAEKGCKLKIEKRGGKLYLRGSLPSKKDKNSFIIQRISLGVNADNLGLEEAEKKLQLVSLQLELGQFEWENYVSNNKKLRFHLVISFHQSIRYFV